MKRRTRLGLLLISIILFVTACGKQVTAKEYAEAVLDVYFKGDTSKIEKVDKTKSKADWKKDYEKYVKNFTENTCGDVEMNEELSKKYVMVFKKIFSAMKYSVKKEEEVGENKYEVTVEFQSTNVLNTFFEGVKTNRENLLNRATGGEFQGSAEEIQKQVGEIFLNDSYTILEDCSNKMEFNGKETEVLTIKKDKDKYSVEKDSLDQLFQRIFDKR